MMLSGQLIRELACCGEGMRTVLTALTSGCKEHISESTRLGNALVDVLTSMVTAMFNMQFASGDLSEGGASARHVPWLGALSLFFFCLLASTSQSWADDYDVDFGAEVRGVKDAGSVTCRFDQVCSANIEALGLRLTIDVLPEDRRSAQIRLYGSDLSCCYFAGAADSKTIDLGEPLSKVPFYRGRPAQGELLIQNEYVGTLYIRIRRRRDR
jgi:hypothetical protein